MIYFLNDPFYYQIEDLFAIISKPQLAPKLKKKNEKKYNRYFYFFHLIAFIIKISYG